MAGVTGRGKTGRSRSLWAAPALLLATLALASCGDMSRFPTSSPIANAIKPGAILTVYLYAPDVGRRQLKTVRVEGR